LSVVLTPVSTVVLGLDFLKSGNASEVLNQTIQNLNAFKSNNSVSTLPDKGFFINYSNAVIYLLNANNDFLDYLAVQNNQTSVNFTCSDYNNYERSLFFFNRSIQEVLNASVLLNSTVVQYPGLAGEAGVESVASNLNAFASGLQSVELKEEGFLDSYCQH
jgi:hypothetical protein